MKVAMELKSKALFRDQMSQRIMDYSTGNCVVVSSRHHETRVGIRCSKSTIMFPETGTYMDQDDLDRGDYMILRMIECELVLLS